MSRFLNLEIKVEAEKDLTLENKIEIRQSVFHRLHGYQTPPLGIPIKDMLLSIRAWQTENPKEEGSYLCRMDDSYIKMCHWTGTEWLDMWQSTLKGKVVEWIAIPY
jgi:hypothetical protein